MAKKLRCRFGFHRWKKEWDHEKAIEMKQCQDCDTRMAAHTGDTRGYIDGGAGGFG